MKSPARATRIVSMTDGVKTALPDAAGERTRVPASFTERFAELFHSHFHRVFRVLDRLSGEPELAADLAQEAFVRLHARGELPDRPDAWLITVALNLFRNSRTSRSRRRRLATPARAEAVLADPAPSPVQAALAAELRERVRGVLDRLPQREQQMLLLRAEGYAYRDIAELLGLNEASVGTLLARAKEHFREEYLRAGGDWDELDPSR